MTYNNKYLIRSDAPTMTNYWPRFTRDKFENSVPPIDYLEWYIPRLQEARTHNLSFSGMQYNWDIQGLLGKKLLILESNIWQILKIQE